MKRMSGEARRRQIVEAAVEAMLRRGLSQAATRDVTQAIGVGAGLLHHYFPSWAELRAEAVRAAAEAEIAEVAAFVRDPSASEALDRLAAWMVEDDDMRHWRLWLDAQEEAHRDDRLAEVMRDAMAAWRALVEALLVRLGEEGGRTVAKPGAASRRLCALMDGLAGAMLVKGGDTTPAAALELLRGQIALETGAGAEG
ncbi:MAG: TetR family transcriptional regulator C-terminal domain-containing protein [Pseudomonadota bacterium]